MLVDLNADAAESEADLELFSLVSSVNLACTAHAGDVPLLRRALQRATGLGVQAGAHPGYADRAGFGRVELGLSPAQIRLMVAEQLALIGGLAADQGVRLSHVKAHGALYNRIAIDVAAARAVAQVAAEFQPGIALFLPAGPRFETLSRELADLQVQPVPEGFPDRAYLSDGSLAPRSLPGAVLEDPLQVGSRALAMARGESFTTLDGGEMRFAARSLCLHGDHSQAAANASEVRRQVTEAGYRVAGV